jgi:MFS family permease
MAHANDGQFQKVLTVFFGFMALALAFSARAALGLVMPVWESELGWSRSFVSGAGAAALIVMACVAPAAGRLADQKGARWTLALGLSALALGCAIVATTSNRVVFLIGFSGIGAIGFGIVATHVVSTAVARSFDQHRGLAMGVATSGATGGQFLVVPLIAGLLAYASWRWSFAGLALACVFLVPCVLWFMTAPSKQVVAHGAGEAGGTTFTADLRSLLTKPVFHVLFWSFLICGYTTTGVIETHFIPYAAFCGFGPIPSAGAYGLLSAVNMLGMIGAGWLTDRMNRPVLLATIYILRALCFIVLMHVGTSIETLYIFAALFGIVDYATVPVTASLVASHLGLRVMGLAMGLISAGHAIGGAIGAFIGGYFFDLFASYGAVWATSLGLSMGAGVLVLAIANRPRPGTVPA